MILMERLKNNWITDGLIDFEYKKYLLLGYLKNVQKAFNKVELYPSLSDLIMHYENLLNIKKGQQEMKNKFPKQLHGLDMEKLAIIYKELIEDSGMMKEMEEIVEYSIPMFKNSLNEGKEIYEFVEEQCEFSPVGLLPLYVDEGYLLINNSSKTETNVYRYQMTFIQSANERFRGINTTLIAKLKRGVGQTFENLKSELISKFTDLPNPATFAIQAKMKFPFTPTLEPVAKRLLVRYVSTT